MITPIQKLTLIDIAQIICELTVALVNISNKVAFILCAMGF